MNIFTEKETNIAIIYIFLLKIKKIAEPLKKNNVLCWVPIAEGIRLLKREGHKWAVTQWVKNDQKSPRL